MFQRNGRGPLAALGDKIRARMPVGLVTMLGLPGKIRSKEGRQELLNQSYEYADNTTRAVTAGMGIADVRALFRGDPPIEKPNPRYKVFTNAFWMHLRPRYYERSATKFQHTFFLGFFSVFTFAIETITGLILMVWYIPSQDQAYQSMIRIITEVPFGQLMRDIHRVGAELMVIFVALHMLRVYLTGSYKHPRTFTWVTGVVLLILTLGLSYSGYLLPWDQLAYWAVTIGTSMAKSAPPKEIAGYFSNLLLRGGDTIGQNGLLRFYLGHVILLPLLAIIMISVHYYRVSRLHSISMPAGEEESPDADVRKKAKERVDVLPDLITRELMWIAIGTFATVAFSVWAFHAPLEHHSDVFRTPLHTTAPWYFLWIQGMLKDPIMLPTIRFIDSITGLEIVKSGLYDSPAVQGVILPTVIFVVLFAVPYIDEWWDKLRGHTSSRMGSKRVLGISMGIVALILLVVFTYFGTPFFAVTAPPAVEIGQEFMPEECVLPAIPLLPDDCGEVRKLGFEGNKLGTYNLDDYANVSQALPTFELMLARMQRATSAAAERARATNNQAGLQNVKGEFIVEDWQPNLKKITLRLVWSPMNAADSGAFDRTIYLHKDSVYE